MIQTSSMHETLMGVARKLVDQNCELYDDEMCFNRFTFLEDLGSEVDGMLYAGEVGNGRFELSGHSVARYLYCCLCLETGDRPDGDTFRQMPILD